MEIAAIVISAVSLVVSIISFVFSSKSQYLQDKVNEIELKLKEYELEEKEKDLHKAPCIEARINHIEDNKYKINIWNSGNAVAKNVTASWDEEKCFIFLDEKKMPFESLEPQKSFNLSIFTTIGSPSKICITTEWEDIDKQKHNKEQWCDF